MLPKIFSFTSCVVIILLSWNVYAGDQPVDDLIRKIVERARQNDELSTNYGFFQQTTVRKLTDKGEVKKIETRTYRTVWLEGKPYAELIQIDGRELNSKEKAEEAKRRSKFLESLKKRKQKKSEDEEKEDFTWEDLYAKYDFTLLLPDKHAPYVFSFVPKKKKLPERSRAEKILNHMSGTIWVDQDHNILRIESQLADDVSFGWGIFAKIQNLEMVYTQQPYDDRVWLPANTRIRFKGRIALFKNENQEISIRLYDFFERPDSSPAVAGTGQ